MKKEGSLTSIRQGCLGLHQKEDSENIIGEKNSNINSWERRIKEGWSMTEAKIVLTFYFLSVD